jgi:hypothetical protein
MEPQTLPSTALQSVAHPAPRRPYAPPTVTFVPLKLEERLMACCKTPFGPICNPLCDYGS